MMVQKRFTFDPFLLDTGRQVLFEQGVPVAIGTRAPALLRALLEARGQVVTKSALINAAWPHTSVEESNLTVQIASLRRRLRGSSGKDWIETFPRLGYRFAGPFNLEEYETEPDLVGQPTLGAQAWRGVGLAYSKKAVSLDPTDPSAHRALGYVRLYARELDKAEAELQVGLTVTPAHADLLANMADLKVFQGQPQEAIAWVEKALLLNPDPADWYYWSLGFAHYAVGRYAEAVDALCKDEVDRLPAKRILAASLAQLGRMDEAREEARRFLNMNPDFRVSHWAATQPFSRNEDRQHFVDGYVKAGLPK